MFSMMFDGMVYASLVVDFLLCGMYTDGENKEYIVITIHC